MAIDGKDERCKEELASFLSPSAYSRSLSLRRVGQVRIRNHPREFLLKPARSGACATYEKMSHPPENTFFRHESSQGN
eukprot:scaffold270_cov347-Pavlova_lutheri.AAC.13